MPGRKGDYPHVYPKCVVRPSTRYDVATLAPRMRKADIFEVETYSGKSSDQVLKDSFDNSKICLSIDGKGGDIVAMFGVGWTGNPRVGLIWLLATPEITSLKSTFLIHSRDYVQELMKGHDLLYNHVHDKNVLSFRWLQWLGFESTGKFTPQPDCAETFTEFAKFVSKPVKELYLKRDWQAFLSDCTAVATQNRAPGCPGAPRFNVPER
jgi:hypothetical protein